MVKPLTVSAISTVIAIDELDKRSYKNETASAALSALLELSSRIPRIKLLFSGPLPPHFEREVNLTQPKTVNLTGDEIKDSIIKYLKTELPTARYRYELADDPAARKRLTWPTDEQLDDLYPHIQGQLTRAVKVVHLVSTKQDEEGVEGTVAGIIDGRIKLD